MFLPHQVIETNFLKVIDEFRAVAGSESVYSDADDIALSLTPFARLGYPRRIAGLSGCCAQIVKEVSVIVKIAKNTCSCVTRPQWGRTWATAARRGPNQTGSVICYLKHVNQMLEIDGRCNFCMLELGVSYFDLYNAVEAQGKYVLGSGPIDSAVIS